MIHLTVTDVKGWWTGILALDLTSRYGVKTSPPQTDAWATVAAVTDPCGGASLNLTTQNSMPGQLN